MSKEQEYLIELGHRLKSSTKLEEVIKTAGQKNAWFVPDFVNYAIEALVADILNKTKLETWLGRYKLKPVNKTIGLIFAGNIPLVGFHDFLCCYVAGCKMKIKLSSKDDELFPFVLKMLSAIDNSLNDNVQIIDRLKDFDAVIATGSNNTNRYFEYYFRNYPKILRKNRNSIAILTGDETNEELQKLADDIFLYFGFGCHNVSKLYVPVGYDFNKLFPQFSRYSWLHGHSHYMNNYDYNRTILLLNKTTHLANEFVMLVENPSIASPIATVNYEYWHDEQLLNSHLKHNEDKIQCVVSSNPAQWHNASSFSFGQSQRPELWDYADGVDSLSFLLSL